MLTPRLTPELTSMRSDAPALFEWDQWKLQSYFYYSFDEELARYQTLTANANCAFMLAICEWIEHRFSGLNDDPLPLEYIAAGWGAIFDPDNSSWFLLTDDDWPGPIRSPLMVTIGIVNDAFYESGDDPDMAVRVCYALNIARHVLPEETSFELWRERVEARLFKHHLAAEDPEMTIDIFEEDFPSGHIVPRDLFDTSQDYIREGGPARLAEFVRDLERFPNRFLKLGQDF